MAPVYSFWRRYFEKELKSLAPRRATLDDVDILKLIMRARIHPEVVATGEVVPPFATVKRLCSDVVARSLSC